MIIAFAWKPAQVCLCATCMLQQKAHAHLEQLEKAAQGHSVRLLPDLPEGYQMVCYFFLSCASCQPRDPARCKWCLLFSPPHSRLQTRDLCQEKVWHPFCNVSVAQRVNIQDGEGCYFNLHAIAIRFGWLTQNVCDTYLNRKCSVFVRQTILWQLVFCHSPE